MIREAVRPEIFDLHDDMTEAVAQLDPTESRVVDQLQRHYVPIPCQVQQQESRAVGEAHPPDLTNPLFR